MVQPADGLSDRFVSGLRSKCLCCKNQVLQRCIADSAASGDAGDLLISRLELSNFLEETYNSLSLSFLDERAFTQKVCFETEGMCKLLKCQENVPLEQMVAQIGNEEKSLPSSENVCGRCSAELAGNKTQATPLLPSKQTAKTHGQPSEASAGFITAAKCISQNHAAKKPPSNSQPEPPAKSSHAGASAEADHQFNSRMAEIYIHPSKKHKPAVKGSESSSSLPPHLQEDERLRGIEPKMIELIMNEVVSNTHSVGWEDIAGLDHAKTAIKEIIIWPMLRPDIFNGLRQPPKGLLLFGPPGTGKTLIGKCIASQANATFFSISASSLTSKWVGEGEKMVRAMFCVARCCQPAVVFIDEIDSILTSRSEGEVEASRRIKTEFLVQFDGAGTCSNDRILVIGATNRPQELDEAARRRLIKRLYIPLPDAAARRQIVLNLLASQSHTLTDDHLQQIVFKTNGYSGSDMHALCREAVMYPIRCAHVDILNISVDEVRPVSLQDFISALTQIRPSVSSKDLDLYTKWNSEYGSLAIAPTSQEE